MNEHMTSPFASYSAPPISEIFTPYFKIALLEYKMEKIAFTVATSLLEENNMDRLFEREVPMKVRYNVRELGVLGLINDDSELDHLAEAVKTGLKMAFEEVDSNDDEVSIQIVGEYEEYDPDIAIIRLYIVD